QRPSPAKPSQSNSHFMGHHPVRRPGLLSDRSAGESRRGGDPAGTQGTAGPEARPPGPRRDQEPADDLEERLYLSVQPRPARWRPPSPVPISRRHRRQLPGHSGRRGFSEHWETGAKVGPARPGRFREDDASADALVAGPRFGSVPPAG